MKDLKALEKFAYSKNLTNSRKTAIIYTRVSTKEQAENNTSLETQLKYCKKYAEENNLDVVAFFGGTYESAKSDERKEFQKMIRYSKQNNTVGSILVYSYDRFSRTGTNAAFITQELGKMGIKVISVSQQVNTDNPGGVFQQNLFYLFSQFDNEMRRDKTVTAMTELLQKGYWLWNPPRGYENTKKYHKAVEWSIEINSEGELLKKAFKWRANNTYSAAGIVRKLNFMGMKINEKRILEIFRNPFYCGILVSKLTPGKVIEGNHEPLVSKEDFLKINQPENIEKNRTYDTMSEHLPLKKTIKCIKCGNPLTGFLNKKKNIYYYNCQKKCLGQNFNAIKLNDQFETFLSSFKINPALAPIIEEIVQYKTSEIIQSDLGEETKIKAELTKHKKELETLEERFAFGKIDEVLYEKFKTKLDTHITELEENLANPHLSSSNLKKGIRKCIQLSKNINKIWASGDVFEKHKLQKLIFPDGIGYDKQMDQVLTSRVNSIFTLTNSISNAFRDKKTEIQSILIKSPLW